MKYPSPVNGCPASIMLFFLGRLSIWSTVPEGPRAGAFECSPCLAGWSVEEKGCAAEVDVAAGLPSCSSVAGPRGAVGPPVVTWAEAYVRRATGNAVRSRRKRHRWQIIVGDRRLSRACDRADVRVERAEWTTGGCSRVSWEFWEAECSAYVSRPYQTRHPTSLAVFPHTDPPQPASTTLHNPQKASCPVLSTDSLRGCPSRRDKEQGTPFHRGCSCQRPLDDSYAPNNVGGY